MRSIERRFKMMERKYPNLSDYIHLLRAITHQRFSEKSISRAFSKLVSKDSYSPDIKRDILKHLTKFSNNPEESLNQTKNDQCRTDISLTAYQSNNS